MLRMFSQSSLRTAVRNSALYIQMALLAVAGFAPLLGSGSVDAAQLTSRSVTITSSKAGQTGVSYNFQFNYATTTPQSVILQFCSTPLGTCTIPNSMNVSSATIGTLTNFNSGTAGSRAGSATNDCTAPTTTMICFPVTGASAGAGTGATIPINAVTNPTPSGSNNITVYVRISLYSNNNYTGPAVHDGTVAAAINQQLTVSGRVQEKLNFCVAAVQDTGTTDAELPASFAACSALTGTNDSIVDLGVIDSGAMSQSPVPNNPPSTLGNGRYGIAMLNTNASNGTSINYYAEADGGTNQQRSFRVPGATCDALTTSLVDQCFQTTSDTDLNGGSPVEGFGMNIPCIIDTGSTTSLSATATYDDEGTTTAADDCEKNVTGAKLYTWNTTASAVPIATSGTNVVDNEIVKLNFAARTATTTPTGAYTVVSTFIATPTF
jgi:hypothetical protein